MKKCLKSTTHNDSRAKAQSQVVFVMNVGHNMSGLTPNFVPNVGPKGPVCELTIFTWTCLENKVSMILQDTKIDLCAIFKWTTMYSKWVEFCFALT